MVRQIQVPQSAIDRLRAQQTTTSPAPARRSYSAGREFDWSKVDGKLLGTTLQVVVMAGAALTLGRTSDGGAASITVLDGDERRKQWPTTTEAAEEYLRWLRDEYATG